MSLNLNNRRCNLSFLFLGGSCDPTTWRADIAIPTLTSLNVAFFNPQVADWSPELVAIEAKAKKDSSALLFVIDGQTRAIASMLEALSQAAQGRRIFVTSMDITDGTVIAGQPVTGRELKDLNRGRAYFLDELSNFSSATVHGSIAEAVTAAADYIKSL